MANNVAASMKASIIIDKKEIISSALSAYAEAQKEIAGNKIELLVDVSDDKARERLKEISKELAGKDYVIKFKNQGIEETMKSLDELFGRIKDIINLSNGINLNPLNLDTNIHVLQQEEAQIKKVISSYEKLLDLKHEIKNVGKSSYSGKYNTDWIGYYKNQEDAIKEDLANKKQKLNSSLNLILSEDKNALASLEGEANKLKTSLQSVQDMVNRISSNSSLANLEKNENPENLSKKYAEAYKAIDDRLAELGSQYKLTNAELEEFITLQVKAEKIMEKMASQYGGVQGSGAKNKAELRNWIEKTFAGNLGLNPEDVYNGLFRNITDTLYSGGRADNALSLFDEAGTKRSLRDISAEILKYKSTISGFDGSFGAKEDTEKLKEISSILSYIKKNASEIESTDFSAQIKKASEAVEAFSKELAEGGDTDFYSKALEEARQELRELIELQERLDVARGKKVDDNQSSSTTTSEQLEKQERQTLATAEAQEKLVESEKNLGKSTNLDEASAQIDKLQGKLEELSQKYKELSEGMVVSGKDVDLVNNEEFQKLSKDFSKLKQELSDLKAHMGLVEQASMSYDAFIPYENKINSLSIEVETLTNKLRELSIAQKNLDSNGTNISSGNEVNSSEVKNNEEVANAIRKKKAELASYEMQVEEVLHKLDKLDYQPLTGKTKDMLTLTSQLVELEEKISKVKAEIESFDSITSMKDTFQGDAKSSAESSAPAIKEEAKAMEQVAENAEKASKGKEKFAKANKNVKASADASTGSIEKENSALDEKVWEKNLKVIQEYMDANTKLNKLNAKDKGTGKHASDIARQEKEVEKLRESAIEARAALSSMVNPHEAPIDDWGKWVEAMEKFEQATKGSAESVAKLEDALRSARNAQLSSIDSTINNSQSKLDDFSARKAQSDAYKNSLIELGVTIERLRTLRASLSNTRAFTAEEQAQIDALTQSVRDHVKEIQRMPAGEKGSDALSRDKWANRIKEYMEKNTRLTREFREELENLIRILRTGGDSVVLKDVIGQFEDAKFRIKEAKLEGKSFFDIFKDKAVYGFAAKLANYYLSFYDFIRYGRYAINTVVELNTQMINLSKVSEQSVSQISDDFSSYAKTAKEVGATISDTISATTNWAKNGYNIPDSQELAEVALIYKNVGDIDIESANESLISTIRGFKLEAEDAMRVIDVFNEVSNNEAISAGGIGEALKRSAASFSAANTSLEQSVALITATRLQNWLNAWKHVLRIYLIAIEVFITMHHNIEETTI